jgi:4-amino-4-deoxy-L-arabinose transferase and related glycosyltransferases of PMT family
MKLKYGVAGAALALLLAFVVQVGLSTRQQSPSWDEGDHIYSGYVNWINGEYTLNPEHPPLVKLVATLPLVPLDLKTPPRQGRYFKDEAYFGGRELIFRNDPKYGGKYGADTLLFRVHMAALTFGVILAVILFLAGNEMFGATAGLITMALFVFDPSILANAPFVTTDTGAACGFFATVYLFYRFVRRMNWQRAAICGVALGLALTAKHSAIVLFPVLVMLAVGELAGRWMSDRQFPAPAVKNAVIGLGLIGAAAWLVVWAVYGFRFNMQLNGLTMPPLQDEVHALKGPMRWFILFGTEHRLLPASYLYGLADVQNVGEAWPTYFMGKIYTHGIWYYFPTVLAVKLTVGTLATVALAIWVFATGKIKCPREIFFLGFPAAFYLAVAMAGPLDMGVRHILPIFPFCFALLGAALAWLFRRSKPWAWVVGALLVAHAAESLRTFPNYIPFGNALWGGPAKTHEYFSDAAVDWAQQLKWTKQWLDENNVKECSFAYFAAPFLLPADYDIPCKLLPTFDTSYIQEITVPPVVKGPVLISYGDLAGYEFGTWVRNPYEFFNRRKPDAVIKDAIAVYYGDFAVPDATAMAYIRRANRGLRRDPVAALAAARQAVALVPNGFDANRALGDALEANGDFEGAKAAYRVVMSRLPEMEPSAQERWRPMLERRIAELETHGKKQ